MKQYANLEYNIVASNSGLLKTSNPTFDIREDLS